MRLYHTLARTQRSENQRPTEELPDFIESSGLANLQSFLDCVAQRKGVRVRQWNSHTIGFSGRSLSSALLMCWLSRCSLPSGCSGLFGGLVGDVFRRNEPALRNAPMSSRLQHVNRSQSVSPDGLEQESPERRCTTNRIYLARDAVYLWDWNRTAADGIPSEPFWENTVRAVFEKTSVSVDGQFTRSDR